MAGNSGSLPPLDKLKSSTLDDREVFVDVRNWVKARQHQQSDLAAAARRLHVDHRRALFDFLIALPRKKPLFAKQCHEILRLLSAQPDWVRDGALQQDLQAALAAPHRPSKTADAAPGTGYPRMSWGLPADVGESKEVDVARSRAIPGIVPEAPSPPRPGCKPPMLEVTSLEELPQVPSKGSEDRLPPQPTPLLQGFPPLESFKENSQVHVGDTFQDLRKWTKSTPIWDLSAAARQLPPSSRADVFRFLTRIGQKKMYSAVTRETLKMLLSVEEWSDGIVDTDLEASISTTLAAPRPAGPPPTPPPPSAYPSAPAPVVQGVPIAPSRPAADVGGKVAVPEPKKPQPETLVPVPASFKGSLTLKQLEAVLRQGSLTIKDPGQLVSLYEASGLNCQGSFKGRSPCAETLRLMIVLSMQRMRDYFTDDLHRYGRGVHFPHIHVDLTRRTVTPLPSSLQKTVEGKILAKERWTGVEKAWVLSTGYEISIVYLLAYAASRATAAGRGSIWISMVMKAGSGSEGHANSIILILGSAKQQPKALVYDPNFAPNQEHWVHALKAVNDALPKVQRMLKPIGIDAPSKAELFGHALQTNLGTTTTRKAWFSSTMYSTRRGYPICGSVVHMLGSLWAQTGGHDNVEQIEALLSDIVASGPEGKALVQYRLAGTMKGLEERLAPNGQDPFEVSLRRRLQEDVKGLPYEASTQKASSQICISDGHGRQCTFSWP